MSLQESTKHSKFSILTLSLTSIIRKKKHFDIYGMTCQRLKKNLLVGSIKLVTGREKKSTRHKKGKVC